MDHFYQVLRKVQKKERNNGTLARVEETFYNDIHAYMDVLKQEAIKDPFSKAPAMLKESQIIATDICHRREGKITESAIRLIQRSYHLFTGQPGFDMADTTPLNMTPEEERFYYSLIETLMNHRQNISIEKFDEDDNLNHTTVIKPMETQTNTLTSPNTPSGNEKASVNVKTSSDGDASSGSKKASVNVESPSGSKKPSVNVESSPKDEVLDRLDEISKAKPIIEKRESIEKQIAKSQNPAPAKPQEVPQTSIEENPNAFDQQDEFFDLESKKIAKDAELVTLLVYDEIGAIVGVDEKIYGPFRPQDLVTLPSINAKIFIKNRKGRQVKI